MAPPIMRDVLTMPATAPAADSSTPLVDASTSGVISRPKPRAMVAPGPRMEPRKVPPASSTALCQANPAAAMRPPAPARRRASMRAITAGAIREPMMMPAVCGRNDSPVRTAL